MNPPPSGLPETLFMCTSDMLVPPGCEGFITLAWDGQAWVGTKNCRPANLGCEAY